MVTLAQEERVFLVSLLSDVRDLLDNVHCYDTEEFKNISVALSILRGRNLKEAIKLNEDED